MTAANTVPAPTPAPGSEPVIVNRHDVGFVFAGLLIAMLLSALDQMIFGTALPTTWGKLGVWTRCSG